VVRVAAAHDRSGRRYLDRSAFLVHNGLVPSRVESIADLAESDQAVLRENRVELVGDRLESAGQIAVRPSPIDIVQHRQQIGDYPTGGELAERTADLQRLQAEFANYRKRVDRDRVVVGELGLA
jgi:hypothetical protein